uniref:Uncharacterized protein n=1 Tax=Globisporangium ultimum (strain ATCC 200006 / CBS 805.95 / DAOM BR144) TaxID=431595 RepID=K3WX60_GLOUD
MDAWRQVVEDATRAVKRSLASDKAVALYETLGSHVVDASTGGVLFWMGVSGAQLLQKAARVGAATRVAPRAVGVVAVAASSAVALHFASLPREIYEALLLRKNRGEAKGAFAFFWPAITPEDEGMVATVRQKVTTRIDEFRDAPYPVYMLMGLLCFKMLGGRMNAIAPSNFSNLGAFHLKKASLPASVDYATPIERGIIQEFGRLYGCHTCGVKQGVKYHADHMPPKLVAKRMNENIFRRLFRQEVTFRFYPQCEPCSNQQGSLVKQSKAKLRTHLLSLRLYHSTGLWLVLLCTGGLYVGGSNFHETSDVPSSSPPTKSADVLQSMNHHGTPDSALLISLRERESKLKRQLNKAKGDASHTAAINTEIDAIERCKASLKTNLKREANKTASSKS